MTGFTSTRKTSGLMNLNLMSKCVVSFFGFRNDVRFVVGLLEHYVLITVDFNFVTN